MLQYFITMDNTGFDAGTRPGGEDLVKNQQVYAQLHELADPPRLLDETPAYLTPEQQLVVAIRTQNPISFTSKETGDYTLDLKTDLPIYNNIRISRIKPLAPEGSKDHEKEFIEVAIDGSTYRPDDETDKTVLPPGLNTDPFHNIVGPQTSHYIIAKDGSVRLFRTWNTWKGQPKTQEEPNVKPSGFQKFVDAAVKVTSPKGK
jgi:hypothetical protein